MKIDEVIDENEEEVEEDQYKEEEGGFELLTNVTPSYSV